MTGMEKNKRILTVKDLTRYIKQMLEADDLLQNVWVQGEISNFTHHSSGHMYFTLKDNSSRVKCIMFSSYNQRLAFMPKEGTKVLACGNVSVYERDGQYQFYVTKMQPDGIGSLYLAYEQLKKKLEQEGLFDTARKRDIPRFPKAVGVVTSPTGAAVRDIMTTLQRRFPSVPVLLYPVSVQGKHAAPSIVKAIEQMNVLQEVDVMIVGRGGGSLEELWAFNEEIVARSIYASDIPIISAVGHETDFTIADFVADLRAATPTAAAELAVPHQDELKQQLQQLHRRVQLGLQQQVRRKKDHLHSLMRSPYFLYPRQQLLQSAESLDRMKDRLVHQMKQQTGKQKEKLLRMEHKLTTNSPHEQLRDAKKKVETANHQLKQAMHAILRNHQQRFLGMTKQLDALSPLKVMQRGYSLVYTEQQTLLKSVKHAQPGDIVKIRLSDGSLDCQVWSIKENEGGSSWEKNQ